MNARRRTRTVTLVALAAMLALGVAGVSSARADDAWLGVYMQGVSHAMAKALHLDQAHGVLVSQVADDSPAAKAGLEEGDVIVRFDGHEVESPEDLRRAVEEADPGERVEVIVLRDGKEKKIEVELGERPEDFDDDDSDVDIDFDGDSFRMPRFEALRRMAIHLSGPRLGVEAAELNDDLAPYFKVKDGEGVLVLDVHDDTIAEKAGIKAGDVIRRIGDERVDDIDDVREALSDVEPGDEIEIEVVRRGKTKKLEAKVDEDDLEGALAFRMPRWRMRAPRAHGVRPEPPRGELRDLRRELDRLRDEVDRLKRRLDESRG